jgi:hypothetical protein
MIPFHPLAELFPLIEGKDFDDLVADVKSKGLLDPINILGGSILDGRNRYRAAIAAGILDEDDAPEDRPRFFSRYVPDIDGDPLSFVISKNLKRRHLDDIQRASIGGKIANLSRGRPGMENPPIGGISVAQAAATLNVAPRQIERARVVHDQGVPELRDALDRGAVAVSAAEEIARKPEQEQRAEIAARGILPNGARAIMGSRQEPDDSLDFFPTPPWATRALLTHVWARLGNPAYTTAWEPACGEGHISEVLREYFGSDRVVATDIFDYGHGPGGNDFLNPATIIPGRERDWIITNPPFGEKSEAFVLRAVELAQVGVAMFVRLQWLETIGRYERIFRDKPPTLIAFFAERVNLCKGRWDPDGGTATAYIWLVWMKGCAPQPPYWIPPGCNEYLTRPDDRAKFAAWSIPTDEAGATVPYDPTTGEVISEAAE